MQNLIVVDLQNLDTQNFGLQAIGKTGMDNEAVGMAMKAGANPMCEKYGGKFCNKGLVNLSQDNYMGLQNLDTQNFGLQAIGKTGMDNEALGMAMKAGANPMCEQYGGKFCNKGLINL